jgi:hypothetical protein
MVERMQTDAEFWRCYSREHSLMHKRLMHKRQFSSGCRTLWQMAWSRQRAFAVATLGTLLILSAGPGYASVVYISDATSTLEVWNGSTVSPFATLPSGQAEGLAVDSAGDVFVASTTGNIYKYAGGNPLGVTTFATVGGVLSGLALDNAGNLYAANLSSGQIDKITSGGGVSPFTTGAPFSLPIGLTVAGSNLFVADNSTNTITQVALSNANESSFTTLSGGPFGLATDGLNLFVSQSLTDQILSLRIANAFPTVLVIFPDSAVGGGLATDGLGNLFVGKVGGTNGSELVEVPTAGGVPTILANLNSAPNFLAVAPVPAATPEPGSLALLLAGTASLLCLRAARKGPVPFIGNEAKSGSFRVD